MKEECGVTQYSLKNAEELITKHGIPIRFHFLSNNVSCDYSVIVTFPNGFTFCFTGFSWGYGGEGPHGLDKFLVRCQSSLTRAMVESHSIDGITDYVWEKP